MRSMVEGACGAEAGREADAPSTTLLRSAVPLPRFAGQDDETRCRRISVIPRKRESSLGPRAGAG